MKFICILIKFKNFGQIILVTNILFLSHCYNYTIKVNTLPKDEVEVFINGVPKGKTDTSGELEFNYKDTPSFRSPIIYTRNEYTEGWFQCNFKNRFWYKNVCNFELDTNKYNLYGISVTFLLDSNLNSNPNICLSGKTTNFSKPYILKPPNSPRGRIIVGTILSGLGIVGNIIGINMFSNANDRIKKEKENPDSFFLSSWAAGFEKFWGSVLMGAGTISIGIGTPLLINSHYKWKNYKEWKEYYNLSFGKVTVKFL